MGCTSIALVCVSNHGMCCVLLPFTSHHTFLCEQLSCLSWRLNFAHVVFNVYLRMYIILCMCTRDRCTMFYRMCVRACVQ